MQAIDGKAHAQRLMDLASFPGRARPQREAMRIATPTGPASTPGATLVLRASCPVTAVNGRAAASWEKRMDSSKEIAWFDNILNSGDILNMEGPLVEIGSSSVFASSAVGGWL